MSSAPSVAIAILHQGGRFLLQLRDERPDILYPGHWGLFGGHLDPGETPEAGLRRELQEEIGYCPATVHFFGRYDEPHVVRHVFWADLDVGLEQLVLTEGWDLALVPISGVRAGEFYSPKPNALKPLGKTHQKILLDFARERGMTDLD